MHRLTPLALIAACGVADPEFSAYDPDQVGMEQAVEELAPEAGDDLVERRATGSFGPMRQAITLAPPPGANSPVVGLTAPSMGRWMWPGRRVGPTSGAAACDATFAGSHVCSVDEVLEADDANAFRNLPDTQMWVGLPVVNGAPFNLQDTCQGLTYNGAHLAWNGASFHWRTDPATGQQALKYRTATGAAYDAECLRDLQQCNASVPSGAACNTARPIVCCQ